MNVFNNRIWLEAMETKLNTYRYQMIESNQMFEEFEKKINEKMELKKAHNMNIKIQKKLM